MFFRSAHNPLRMTAAGCALLSAVSHLMLVPEHLGTVPYVGVLFTVGGLALLTVAVALVWADLAPAWLAGAAVSGGMILGFALSRTVGLPGYREEGWDAPYGVLCMIAEVLFLAAFGIRYGLRRTSPASRAPVRRAAPTGR